MLMNQRRSFSVRICARMCADGVQGASRFDSVRSSDMPIEVRSALNEFGAEGGTRTHTTLRSTDFKSDSSVSPHSTTRYQAVFTDVSTVKARYVLLGIIT